MRHAVLLLAFLLACSSGSSPTPTPDSGTPLGEAPDTVLVSSPPALTNQSLATFQFSSPTVARFVCSLDQGAFQACASPFNVRLADGAHQFAVAAVDGDQQDPTPATASWTIDTVAPTVTLDVPSVSASPSATFTASEQASFECSVDGASFTSCATPLTLGSLPDGSHQLSVRAIDLAGNVGSAASKAFTVDTTPPALVITSGPAGATNSTTATFVYDAGDATSLSCTIDSATVSPCASGTAYAVTAGTHHFRVTAQDAIGNSASATWDWTVDLTAPDTSITSGPSGTVTTASVSIAFTSTEAGSTFQCSLDGAAYASCTSPASYGPLVDGDHTFSVQATDPAGNLDLSPATASWTTSTTTPTTSITGHPNDPTNSTSASFTFTSTKQGTFECALDSLTWGGCSSPQSYSGLAAGSHTFHVRAIDTSSNVDPNPPSYTWTIDLTPPDTSIDSGPSGTSGSDVTFTFSSTESGSTFLCSMDGATATSCSSPKSYTGLSAASHTFTVAATDPAGNPDPTPASRTWSVTSSYARIRLMAANLSSGNHQSYDDPTDNGCTATDYGEGEGKRLIESVKPDVVMIQEFNYIGPTCSLSSGNGDAEISGFVNSLSQAVGFTYSYYREPYVSGGIPNGIISRYPILASGHWTDSSVSNRSYTWAEIDIPGSVNLWAISVHLLTKGSTYRSTETSELLNTYIKPNIPAGDYVVIGGDYNTQSRGEQCIVNLQNDFVTTGESGGNYPQDQNGNDDTNQSRGHPEDWVLANNALDRYATTVTVGAESFPYGLVLDSRVFNTLGELSDITPVLANDSYAYNSSGSTTMQHMGIVRDFLVPQ